MNKRPRLWHFFAIIIGLVYGNKAIGQTIIDVCTGQVIPGATAPGYKDWNGTDTLSCPDQRSPTVSGNAAGVTAWRYCKNTDGFFTMQWAAVTWTQMYQVSGLLTALATSGGTNASNEKVNELAQQFKSNQLPLSHASLTPVWCPTFPTIRSGVPAPDHTACAGEGGICVVPTGKIATVWYGAGNFQAGYVAKTNVTGSVGCNNTAFGKDPKAGSTKSCGYLVTGTTVTPAPVIPTQGVVSLNGTSTTRPSYTVTGGVRSKTPNSVRAPVGAPCVPSVLKVMDAGFEYSAWLISQASGTTPAVTSAPLVTSCTK